MSKIGKRRLSVKSSDKLQSAGPLDSCYARCEKFASNMLASYFLYSLPFILADEEENDDPYHKLEIKLAMQIIFDSIDESSLLN